MKKSLFTFIILSICSLLAAQFIVWHNGQIVFQSDINKVDSITLYDYNISDDDQSNEQGNSKNIVVKVKVPSNWTYTTTAWVWDADGEGREVETIRDGDWNVLIVNSKEVNVIFKNGWGWNGDVNQTEEIIGIRKNMCFQLQQKGAQKVTSIIVDCPSVDYDLTLERESINLLMNEQKRIYYTLTPEYANEIFDVEFISLNEAVATVSNDGVITGVSEGETIINVVVNGTNIKASCKVVVIESLLDATVFDRILQASKFSDPFDVVITKQDGQDTTLHVVSAKFLMIPSTMYLDGEGYLVGEPGYCMSIYTSFTVGLDPNTGAVNAYYALADYSVVDNAVNDKGYFIPWSIQTGNFNKQNYCEYWTNMIFYSNGAIEEEPIIDNYPYYDEFDSYMVKGFNVSYGIYLMDAGYPTIAEGNEAGIIQFRATDQNELYPSYYNFDAEIFSPEGNMHGFALEERVDSITGETNSFFMDEDEDNIFDFAPLVKHTFVGGKYDDATEAVAVMKSNLKSAKAIPAAPFNKKAVIIRTLNIPFFMKVNDSMSKL